LITSLSRAAVAVVVDTVLAVAVVVIEHQRVHRGAILRLKVL
jgi:hypothetical protein